MKAVLTNTAQTEHEPAQKSALNLNKNDKAQLGFNNYPIAAIIFSLVKRFI